MTNSGENIGVTIVLNQALPTGIDLYAVVSESFRRHYLTFSTQNHTIDVTDADWKHFAFEFPPAVTVGMNGPYIIELKMRNTDGTYVNIGKENVQFSVIYSIAGHQGMAHSSVLPTYEYAYPRPSGSTPPTSAEVTVSSAAFAVNGNGENSLTATVSFGSWLKGEKGDAGLSTYFSSVNAASGQTSINVSDIVIPSGRTMQAGDMIITQNGLVFSVTAVNPSSVTVVYRFALNRKAVITSLPSSGGLLPNVLYNIAELTGTVTISLSAAASVADEYDLMFNTGTTAPSITWPSNVIWSDEQDISALSHYEVSIRNGYGYIREFPLASSNN